MSVEGASTVGAAAAIAGSTAFAGARASDAPETEPGVTRVGYFSAGGLVFKDNVEVLAVPDPKVKGVTVYLSSMQRPLTDRIKRLDWFSDPTQTSLAVALTGPISLDENISYGEGGEEVFSAKKSLLFKSLRVRRIYDKTNKALVYVAYSTRLSQDTNEQNSRFRTSVAVLPLHRTVDGHLGSTHRQ
ncbi:unnamed protein product [Pedinophyceae sp. YPF-701]|nr:unnamed protein product [Pedinophyceae sp. YPF-701]